MSVMTILEAQGKDWKAYDYLPLGGTGKYEPILNLLKEHPKQEIHLAEDHDVSGVESMQHIQELLKKEGMLTEQIHCHVPENAKDWNEALTNYAKKFKPVAELSFLEKEGLPEIHYCAIQSTKQIEEQGFRVRNGKHQYRLVELDAEGNLIPVALTKQNTMFFAAQDVEKRIPNMYKKLPYGELLERQKLVKSGELRLEEPAEKKKQVSEEIKQEVDKAKQEQAENAPVKQPEEATEQLLVEGFREDQNTLMANIKYKEEELEEAVWKKEDKFYICTGMRLDNTLEEHLLLDDQVEQLKAFLKENHYELDETLPILQLKRSEESQEQKATRTDNYLNQLQQQEMSKNQQVAAPTPMMGMEL